MKLSRALALFALLIPLSLTARANAGAVEDAEAAYRRGDYATALGLLRPLAEQGDAAAQCYLGLAYDNGQGVPQDYRMAAAWLRKAADQGFPAAEHNLGVLYEHGQGVAQDYAAAASWYRKAADHGLIFAQVNLALMHVRGQGVTQDFVEAYKWLSIAIVNAPTSQGAARDTAQKSRDVIATRMTQAQIADAETLAAAWKPTVAAGRGRQDAPADAPFTVPPDDRLDALLAAQDWHGLYQALAPATAGDELLKAMAWMNAKIQSSGGASLLGFIYARDLWGVGNKMKIDDPDRDPRVTAGMIVLYTYELVVIDGTICADRTAPARRIGQLALNPALAFVKAQPTDLKGRLIDTAIALETRTAALRPSDDLPCRNGMEAFAEGTYSAAAAPSPRPGQFGKTVGGQAAADRSPRLLPPETYKPMQEKARAGMRAALARLVQ